MVTPFGANDEVDHDAVSSNVERWLKTPASGFLVGSQSGEEWSLSEDEKLAIVKTVSQTLNGERYVMGGIDCPSVTETLRRAEAFAEAGAELLDSVLVEAWLQLGKLLNFTSEVELSGTCTRDHAVISDQ